MIYRIYSVQKKHNEKEAFFQWFNNYLSQLLGFHWLVTNCSLLKAKERRVTGLEIGEEEQALFSKFIFYIPFPMQI